MITNISEDWTELQHAVYHENGSYVTETLEKLGDQAKEEAQKLISISGYPNKTPLQAVACLNDGLAVKAILYALGDQAKAEAQKKVICPFSLIARKTPLELSINNKKHEVCLILALENIYQYFPGPEKALTSDHADRFMNFHGLWRALKNANTKEITDFIKQAQTDFASKNHGISFFSYNGSQDYLDAINLLDDYIEKIKKISERSNHPGKTYVSSTAITKKACELFEDLLRKREDYRLDNANLSRLELLNQKSSNTKKQVTEKDSTQDDDGLSKQDYFQL